MTDSPKRLGAIVATAATSGSEASGQILYTVPASTSAIVSTIFVCNRGSTTSTFRVAHVQNGVVENLSSKDYIYYDIQLNANDTFASTCGISMATGDSLVIYGASTNINFVAEGIEIV